MGVLIDTSALPASERFASWRRWWARPAAAGVPPVEVLPSGDEPFDGLAAMFRLGAVTLLHVRADASATTIPPESLARLDPPAVLVVVHHRGRGAYLFPHGVARTAPGAITTFPESEPWTLTTETPVEFTVLKAQPRDLGPRVDLPQGASVAEGAGIAPALGPFVRSIATGLMDGSIPDGAPGVGDCLLGAMRATLGSAATGTPTRQALLLGQITAHIDANLADAGLTPRSIAERHYISVRQLHKLFEAEQLTVSRWIRHRRLDRCRAELCDPALADEPVRAIARRWGMANASHFGQAFRAAYGCSPQEYRRRHRA